MTTPSGISKMGEQRSCEQHHMCMLISNKTFKTLLTNNHRLTLKATKIVRNKIPICIRITSMFSKH